jgi:hypothetical protein
MGKRIAIMQPTYLPWIGYFDLIDRVEAFVLLDNVQFEKQSWQQRNRIRTAKDLEWLSIPILNTGHSGQLICDTRIASLQFVGKHLRALKMNYGRVRFFNEIFPEFDRCLNEAAASGMLADLNLGLIRWLVQKLGITTPLHVSSQMGCEGRRSGLLVNICQRLGADEYLSPVGSADYLREDRGQFDQAGIRVWLHGYEHPVYRQLYLPFLPYACVMDLLFNEGPRALEIIRSGRRDPLAL